MQSDNEKVLYWSSQINHHIKVLHKLEKKQNELKKLRNAFSINACENLSDFELQSLRQSLINANKVKLNLLRGNVRLAKHVYSQCLDDIYKTTNTEHHHV